MTPLPASASRRHPLFGAYLALAAVCFFWGTTYLGIRIALESFPVLLLVGTRFTLSGGILLAAAWVRREAFPAWPEILKTARNGLLVLGVASGALTVAQTWIPSGLAALFVTTAPFWLVGMEALVPGGEKLHPPAIIGMLTAACGVALLVAPDGLSAGMGNLGGFLLLQVGNAAWTFGSILQRRMKKTAHPVLSGAIQQFAVGVLYLAVAAVVRPGPVLWSWKGAGALLYLVTFGSIVGFSAFLIALERLPISIVSIYTYVNPVVAMLLGWLVYGERFGVREAVAALIVFLGVWLVKRFS
jgi:drug/metabolite transporter (DMT)-like permease